MSWIYACSTAFVSTTTVFGTAVDISLSELAIESSFPTDTYTAETMRRLGEASMPRDEGAYDISSDIRP